MTPLPSFDSISLSGAHHGSCLPKADFSALCRNFLENFVSPRILYFQGPKTIIFFHPPDPVPESEREPPNLFEDEMEKSNRDAYMTGESAMKV